MAYSFLALVPRGLDHVVQEMVQSRLSSVRLQRRAEQTIAAETIRFVRTKVQEQLSKKQHHRNNVSETCRRVAGTAHDGQRDVSVGYDGDVDIATAAGTAQGSVWLQLTTESAVEEMLQLRCLGPLVLLVDVFDKGINWGTTIEDAVQEIERLLDGYPLEQTVTDWLKCVKVGWNLAEKDEKDLFDRVAGRQPLRYRLSCLRDDSKKYSYSRQELLTAVADAVVPESRTTKHWIVDLTNFDLEIVLLMRGTALAVGLSVRPYRQLKAKSFSGGVLPPDISPPYLSGEVLSRVTRLRPCTAQALLHLAGLSAGEVLLDPCVGIGTIAMEAMFINPSVVALGGDLVLTPNALGTVAADYATKARDIAHNNSAVDCLAWDACSLPLRDEAVDAVVSDLPFGQQCLSSAKLESMLPLLLGDVARVLRRDTGRMVLLCGSPLPILTVLQNANAHGCYTWKLPCEAVFPVNISGLQAWIIKAERGSGAAMRLPRHVERAKKLARKREHTEQLRKNERSGRVKRLQS